MTDLKPEGLTANYSNYSTKFGSPMACYVFEVYLMNGDHGDEDAAHCGNGDWVNRYGRRILYGDDRGFVGLNTYVSAAEAMEDFAEWTEGWYDEDEDDG